MIERLKECRVEKGLTQKELAGLLNITQQTYSDYETGRTSPAPESLIKIADLLETTCDYLLGRTDDFGNVTIYESSDRSSLSPAEQKIIDVLRTSTPINSGEWVSMYSELPTYMQESIFAELKGMYLGYKVSKAGKTAKK